MLMVKSSVILLLLMAQLFCGSLGVQSICMKANGSFCCIDGGAGTCKCCQHDDVCEPDSACCHHCGKHDDEQCCAVVIVKETTIDHADESCDEPNYPTISDNACGCKHLSVSADPATISHRIVVADALANAHSLICIPNDLNSMKLLADHEFHLSLDRPPNAAIFTLISMSCIAMRC